MTFTFLAALIKATRSWASSTQQGRAFGILESGRGVAGVITSTALLALFAKLGSEAFGLSWVIVMFSMMDILIGIMAWFVIKDSKPGAAGRPEEGMKIGVQDILKVIKMPVTWLIALIILTAYSAYWRSYYFTPYATDVFMMSVVFGGALGIGKGCLQISALGAGLLADKIGASQTIAWSFIILIISFVVFAVTPGSPSLVFILVANTVIASIAIYALRGVYFATFEEVGIPLSVTGTATGVVSVIGYMPDIFIPLAGGALLDGYPGAWGYRYFFLFISGLCFLGLLAALVLIRKYIKKRVS
ncbi:MAG: MFS transporter [Candidatus Zixiibacteriota bacterium]